MTRTMLSPRGAHTVVLGAMLACGIAGAVERLEFRLHDASGREVRSQDYKGRPIFLEFGACW